MDYSLEAAYNGIVVGIDEVGRGPLAGPVIAAAAILNPAKIPAGIQDSKKLSAKKREALFLEIGAHAQVTIGMASVEEIEKHNILGATKLAMQRAYAALGVKATIALVDGNQPPKLPCPVKPIIKGDSISVSIAAASIYAKVTRDRMMAELAELYPYYGWESNAGYGSAKHLDGMAQNGLTIHHRRGFEPIRTMLEQGAVIMPPREKPVSAVSSTPQLELL